MWRLGLCAARAMGAIVDDPPSAFSEHINYPLVADNFRPVKENNTSGLSAANSSGKMDAIILSPIVHFNVIDNDREIDDKTCARSMYNEDYFFAWYH